MNSQKSHILFILLVLFSCLSISKVNAAPQIKRNHQKGFSWKDTRLNVDFTWGAVPYGKLIHLFDDKSPIDTHFNYSMRVLAGYSFPIFGDKRIGFETGLGYGFGRVTENKNYNTAFEETHLTIPFLLTFFNPFQTSFYFAHTVILGYEFDMILSSNYQQSGYYPDLQPSLEGDQDVAALLPDFSGRSGNIFVSDRYDFSKGIYAAIACRIPIEMLGGIKNFEDTNRELDMTFVKIMRLFNTNWIEITVGVNMIDWIYPQQGYQKKSNWRKR